MLIVATILICLKLWIHSVFQIFHSTTSTLSSLSPGSQSDPTTQLPSPDSDPIQIAVITGKNSLKLKVKQGERIQGPKVNSSKKYV